MPRVPRPDACGALEVSGRRYPMPLTAVGETFTKLPNPEIGTLPAVRCDRQSNSPRGVRWVARNKLDGNDLKWFFFFFLFFLVV